MTDKCVTESACPCALIQPNASWSPLDVPTRQEALSLASRLQGRVGMLKVGLELFCAEGPAFVKEVQPSPPSSWTSSCTTSQHREPALERLLPLDVRLINIHAQGGPAMIEAAAEAVRAHRQGGGRTGLLAVTVLTSLGREALARMGNTADPPTWPSTWRGSRKAAEPTAWSARRRRPPRCARPAARRSAASRRHPAPGSSLQDQSRDLTPGQALRNGATWLVVGRPITQAPDPEAAADAILAEIAAG